MMAVRTVIALLRRDWVTARTYRLAWVLWLADAVLAMASFFFLGLLVDAGQAPLERYGGYAPFALVGVGLFSYFFQLLTRVSLSIRNAQLNGTLEAILVTRTSALGLIFGTMTSALVARTVLFAGYLVLGVLLFGVSLASIQPLTVAAFWALGVILFSGLVLVSASFILVVKKGDPLNWALGALTWVIGGTFYPVDVLPQWLHRAAAAFPITPLIEGIRAGLLLGASPGRLAGDLAWLGICSLLTAAAGLGCFRYAWRKARRDGTLSHY